VKSLIRSAIQVVVPYCCSSTVVSSRIISGLVTGEGTDETGASCPAAQIIVQNRSTNISVRATIDSAKAQGFHNLLAGTEVTASKDGFSISTQRVSAFLSGRLSGGQASYEEPYRLA